MRKIGRAIFALMLLASFPLAASAHGAGALHSETVVAGPYNLSVGFFNWPLRAEQSANVLLTPTDNNYRNRELGISVILNSASERLSKPLNIRNDSDTQYGYTFDVQPGSVGQWQLLITVRGPQGEGTTSLPINVEGPPTIPVWLGWCIGLSPLLGLLAFAVSERRKVARAKPLLEKE